MMTAAGAGNRSADACACPRKPRLAGDGTGRNCTACSITCARGETVVVWKLDCLSRSLKDVLHIMERIGSAGAGFGSITENIDTTTPAGRMMMQMVGAFGEFERAVIRERTSAGHAAARAEGRIGGRRKKLDAAKRREIAESVISGRNIGAEMARLYNVSAPTVSRIVAEHRTG
jgi:DNA invertase Pin-like site-specific DNA recombinase